MKQDIEVRCERVAPKPILLTIEGVSFWLDGPLAAYYHLIAFDGPEKIREFLEAAKPFYWEKYLDALRIKQQAEEQKRLQHEDYLEKLRIKQNAKRRERRLEMKNGITSPDDTVHPLRGI